jgi:mercuric ion transport protein
MTIGTKGTLAAGVLAALGASARCAGPLVLLMLGVGGWASRLIAFELYSPYFTGLTLLLLGLAFYNLYVRRRACALGDACATDRVIRNQRILYWLVTLPVILLLAFPLYARCSIESIFYAHPHLHFLAATGWIGFRQFAENRHPQCPEYDLSGMPDHRQKSAGAGSRCERCEDRFRAQDRNLVHLDADKASIALLTKATADAGFPSTVGK